MPSSASWRITLYDTQSIYGDNYVVLTLIEFRETFGGQETASGGSGPFATNTTFGDPHGPFNPGGGAWGNNGFPCSIGYAYATPIEVKQVAIHNRPGYPSQAPSHFSVDYLDGDGNWQVAKDFSGVDWANTEQTKTFNVEDPPATQSGVQVPQAAVLVTARLATHDIRTGQAYALAPYNVPAKNMRASQLSTVITARVNSVIAVTQAHKLVVCKGRVADPEVRAFTFTLAGHDFYGLRLGDTTTLLYDVFSQQWIEWTSPGLPFWRANTTWNWVDGQKPGYKFGSDIVVGDDTFGLLYFLNPDQAWDEHPDYTNPTQQLAFDRIVMGQTLVSGRNFIPCYAVFLDGDNYGLGPVDFTPSVDLETSDDQGQSFLDHGTITVNPNTDNQDYRWYSLGQMESPGRLFRITDNGLLARIDSLEMNDDG